METQDIKSQDEKDFVSELRAKIPSNFKILYLISSLYTKTFRKIITYYENQENQFICNLPRYGSTKQSIGSRLDFYLNSLTDDQKVEQRKILIYSKIENEDENAFTNQQYLTIENLIQIANSIIVVSVDEESHFSDCILNHISKTEFNDTLWPAYAAHLAKVFDVVEKTKNETKLYVVDDKQRNAYGAIKDLIERSSVLKDYLLNIKQARQRMQQTARHRENHFISDFIKMKKRDFFMTVEGIEKNWMQRYNSNTYPKDKLIDEMIQTYENRGNLHEEEKSVFKNVITRTEKQHVSICSILIIEAIRLADDINAVKSLDLNEIKAQIFTDNVNILRLVSLTNIFENISTHYIFCHRIFNDSNYVKLTFNLINSNNYLLRLRATRLIYIFLKKDFKRYGSLLILNDQSDMHPSLVRQVLQTIVDLYHPILLDSIKNESTNANEASYECKMDAELQELMSFLEHSWSFDCLEYLLKGSFENCSKMKLEDLNTLISFTKSKQLMNFDLGTRLTFKVKIFRILNMHLKYGDKEIWRDKIDIKRLLHRLNIIIVILIEIGCVGNMLWKKLTNFYHDLLLFLEKDNGDIDEVLTIDQSVNENLIIDKSEPVVNEIMDKSSLHSVDYLKQLYKLNQKINTLRDDKSKRRIFYDEDAKSYAKLLIDNELIKIENFEVRQDLKDEKLKYNELKSKFEVLETDRKSLADELSELRISIDLNKKLVIQENKSFKPPLTNNIQQANQSLNDSIDDNLDLIEANLKEKKIEMSKELAKSIIESLKLKRENLKDFRKLICGSLNHLSANLYSSSFHFLSELIQNFEDNDYDLKDKPWFMKLIIQKTFLVFCSNETGFKLKDIKSICSCSESSKSKGKHIGNKGLGFKSVFLCSDNPVIVSKPYWQFQFIKNSDQDEISYITPHYIDTNEIPPDLIKILSENSNCTTFIYLPLKEAYKYRENNLESKNYFNNITKNVNESVLLFTNKLSMIIIEDNINEEIIKIERQEANETGMHVIESINENNNLYKNQIKLINSIIKMEKTKLNDPKNVLQMKESLTRLCMCKIVIPSDVIQEELLNAHEEWISIGFPMTTNYEQVSCPVFAFLPVYDLGFKFYLNCNWTLVTSRESINEHSRINKYYRQQLENFYVWLAKNDSTIRSRLLDYLPRDSSELIKTKYEWKLFVHDIKSRIKPYLKEVLLLDLSKEHESTGTSSLKPRIYNPKLDSLIDDEFLALTNIKLIHPNKINLNQSDLEDFDIQQLSVEDILDYLNVNSNINLDDWLKRKTAFWWEDFYKLLRNEANKISDVNKIFEAKIFQMRSMKYDKSDVDNLLRMRQSIEIDQQIFYYICDDKKFTMWRSNIRIINYSSVYEKSILTDILNLQNLTVDMLIEHILLDHTMSSNIDVSHLYDIIWDDLTYLKENFEIYLRFNKNLLVLVPNLNNQLFVVEDTALPSLINYDLTQLPLIDQRFYKNFINFNEFKVKHNLSLKETLEWEMFFLNLKCSLPKIDIKRVHFKINDQSLPLFTQIEMFDEQDIKLAVSIIEKLERYRLVQLLICLPIKSVYKENDNYVTSISNTCSSKIFKNLLPSIKLPEYSYDLAKHLGITIDLNLKACLDILKQLVTDKVKSNDLFIEWFLNTKSFMNDIGNYDYLTIPLIHLKSIDNIQKYYSLNDVYCCEEETPGVLLVCEYLNKTIINFKYNSIFKPIETILIQLGCLKAPSLSDIIRCISEMSDDVNLFNNKNILSLLSNKGYENIKEIFLELEKSLRNRLEINIAAKNGEYDLRERNEIRSQVTKKLIEVANEDLDRLVAQIPIVTYERHVIEMLNDQNSNKIELAVCFYFDFINELKASSLYHKYIFFDPVIAKACPLTMGLLNVNYLIDSIDVYLEHVNNNPEETNDSLNEELRKLLNINDLEVLKVKYLAITVHTKNDEENKTVIYNNIKFGLFDKKWLIFTNYFNNDSSFVALLGAAIKYLIKTVKPDYSDDMLTNETRSILERQSYRITQKSSWRTWSKAFQKPTRFNLSDLLIPDDDYDFNELTDVYFTNFSSDKTKFENNPTSNSLAFSNEETSVINPVRKYVNNKYISDEACYLSRLNQLTKLIINDGTTIERENELSFGRSGIVNEERKREIGIKSEHFFAMWLKRHYGEGFNEFENWVSSSRNCVYPSSSRCDNTLGYDFKINDYLNLFTDPRDKTQNVHVKTCFIEVKGSEFEWDGTFHISANEVNFRDQLKKDIESYIIAIIENARDSNSIRIARLIDWTRNKQLIKLEPDSYLAKYNFDIGNNPNQNKLSNNAKGQMRSNQNSFNQSSQSNRATNLQPQLRDNFNGANANNFRAKFNNSNKKQSNRY